MNKTALTAILATGLLTATVTYAEHVPGTPQQGNVYYDEAKVIRVEPVTRYFETPEVNRACQPKEEEYPSVYPDDNEDDDYTSGTGAGGAIIGAIIGGLIGNSVGHGHHRGASTFAGTMIGAHIGSHVDRHSYRRNYNRPRGYYDDCRDVQNYRKERIDAYDVTYRYKGEVFTTRLPYDPGNRIRIRVSVAPTGERY